MSVSVSMEQIKDLRTRTQSPISACQKALQEANGDLVKAEEILRTLGQASAIKKEGRVAAEGRVEVKHSRDHKAAVLIEVNCETDFVARQDNFKAFVQELSQRALELKATDLKEFLKSSVSSSDSKTIDQARLDLVAQLGENVSIRRVAYLESQDGSIGAYGHQDSNGMRIGVLLEMATSDFELGRTIAMQIAAMNPEFLKIAQIPADRLQKEKDIFLAQTREQEGSKPEAIQVKIAEGKLKKWQSDAVLTEQAFVREPNKTIATLLKEHKTDVLRFVRFVVGEGIVKAENNFAEEVMAQTKGRV